MKRFLLAFAVLASPAAAQSLDGIYHWEDGDEATACDPDANYELRIRISFPRIAFLESACDLSNPTDVRGMPQGTLYDAKCTGEGETWAERMMIYQTYDGLALISGGAVRTYSRCE